MARSRFRRFLSTFLALSLVAAAGALALSWLRHRAPTGLEAVLGKLPGDARGVAILRVDEQLLRTLAPLAAKGAALEGLGRTALGFDATDPAAWREAGLDPTRPSALALRDGETWFAAIPVVDGARARATAEALGGRDGRTLAREGDVTLVRRGDRAVAALAVSGDHLLAAGGREPAALLAGQRRLAAAGSLAASAELRSATGRLPDGAHLLAWAAPDVVAALGEGRLEGRSVALGASFDDRELRVEAVASGGPPLLGRLLDGRRDGIAELLSGTPLALATAHLDVEGAWRALGATEDDRLARGARAAQLSAALGIDLESEVIGNLEGPIGAAALVAEDPKLGLPVDVVAWAKLESEPRAREALRRIADRLEAGPEVRGWQRLGPVAATNARGHHVVVAREPRQAIVARDLAGQGGGALAALPPEAQAKLREGPPLFLHLDGRRTIGAARAHLPTRVAAGDALDRASPLGAATVWAELVSGETRLVLHVAAPPGGFGAAARLARPALP